MEESCSLTKANANRTKGDLENVAMDIDGIQIMGMGGMGRFTKFVCCSLDYTTGDLLEDFSRT